MTESLADWLSLREPADAAARSVALTRAIVDVLPSRRPIRVLDLGTGTGSNVRYLAPKLPTGQEWLVVDRDATLLARVQPPIADCRIERRPAELGNLHGDLFARRDLVTASALLDLVSASWLESLARCCRDVSAAALFALTYNGESRCTPPEPEDDLVRMLMNRHQRNNDKGFGRAAGPDAVEAAARAFTSVGYRVRRDRSDWTLAPHDGELQRRLIEGWADAAVEIAPEQSAAVQDWRMRRLAHVAAGQSHVRVGHEDLIVTR